jgi:hypothetical protein
VIVIRNSNYPDQNSNSVKSHVYSSEHSSPQEELIKLGVANIDSGLTGFNLENKKQQDHKISIYKSELLMSDDEKQEGMEFELTQIYGSQHRSLFYSERKDMLFEDQSFELPAGGTYICDNYTTAFIHALNLAAARIVYPSVGSFLKVFS